MFSVRMAWNSFGALPCRGGKKPDDSSRLDVVEIARFPGMLPSLFFFFLVGLRTYQHPGYIYISAEADLGRWIICLVQDCKKF